MTDPNRHIQAVPEDSAPGIYDDIAAGLRVRSRDYGTGTVVVVLGIGIQIHWDTPILGTVNTHYLTHDKAYVAKLERL